MATREARIRGKYNKRTEAVLPKYVDMSAWLYQEYKPAEWVCMKCHSNSLLPMEYGCNLCQPFIKGAKLTGRKYREDVTN